MSTLEKLKGPPSLNNKQLEKHKQDIDNKEVVEYESRDYDGDGDADNKDDCDLDDDNECKIEAVTKEEEWITKRKTELTTTRQIETRVKRSIRFEDGRVIEDSGPIVSTNTTEDTDKQETETTEKHDLGLPITNVNAVDGKSKGALPPGPGGNGELAELSNTGGTLVKSMVTKPADGLVREINDKRVVSHEETKNYTEVEDVKHQGDFSDEAFVKAVTSGVENVEQALLSEEFQKQLVPTGPRLIADKTKSFKTIDSEDVVKRSLAQEDGKIITEQKKITEHEIIVDDELSGDDKSLGSQERIRTVEANQRFFKQRDEQHVDLVKDGKVVGTEMKYTAETMQMDNDDMLERPDDWDSLSDRIRKMRKPYNKSLMQHPKAGGILMDRKDALTKRPLDFDREEETRKGETIKWLESHFGSESTASNDSREEEVDVIEPTKKTYFNVTIKSNQNQQSSSITNPPYDTAASDKKPSSYVVKRSVDAMNGNAGGVNGVTSNGSKYYQGISNWNNRKDSATTPTTPANHFASKAFRDDLHASIERNQLRKTSAVYTSKDNLNSDTKPPYVKSNPSDSYVSREDILQQKRQSLSSQFLARSRQNSRDHLDTEADKLTAPTYDDDRYISGSRTDLHYGLNLKDKDKRSYTRAEVMDEPDSPLPPGKNSYVEERAKSYERTFVENNRYNSLRSDKTPPQREMVATLERPAVPQRRRNGEKKLRQNDVGTSDIKTTMEVSLPPPDYSPPPRSRSSSPREDYHNVRSKSYPHQLYSNSNMSEQVASRETSTLMRKQNQRTRFARNTPSPPPTAVIQHHPAPGHHHNQTMRPNMLTQTTQTTPSTISTSTVASHRSSKVGQVIGNSLRKLVGKLRSASVERKMRMKSKSKSRDQSPAPPVSTAATNQRNLATYQQYNVIDGHIGGNHNTTTSHDDSEEESHHQRIQYQASKTGDSVYSNASVDRRALLHATASHPVSSNNRDAYRVISPKQRYYLGEDPYSSTLYGKENIQDPNAKTQRNGMVTTTSSQYNNRENITSAHTLGRYQKGNHRISGSTPNLNQGYRSTQTLPRKLNDQPPTVHQYETQTMNINRSNVTGKVQSKVRQQQQQLEQRIAYQPITQNTGPLKPARTYAKSLNRSKSFSVHAMNGSNDPSPIYMEKLNGNHYNGYNNNNSSNLQSSHAFKSNPHLYSSSKENTVQQTPLKSPSIVNLISRSQRDLTKIGMNEDESDNYGERQTGYTNNRKYYEERKATPPYRAGSYIEDDYKYRSPGHYHLQAKSSLDSRGGSVEINKDTASIIRHEEYLRTKRTPPSGSTIIKVRNMDYRK
ncbi:chascon isoform X2 [Haematobia irritans]|uniref:chascon isoform X2 n=1 Tax=Haematobia irritans TaxID=7368 RepID=UPI003F5040BD